jgi:hypothetical protein
MALGQIFIEQQQNLGGETVIQRDERVPGQRLPRTFGCAADQLGPIAGRIKVVGAVEEPLSKGLYLVWLDLKGDGHGNGVVDGEELVPFLDFDVRQTEPLGVDGRQVAGLHCGKHRDPGGNPLEGGARPFRPEEAESRNDVHMARRGDAGADAGAVQAPRAVASGCR